MNKETLHNKIWYRALKVIFILFSVIIFVFVNFITWSISDNKQISDKTFEQVGSVIKQIYPVYSDRSDLEIGKSVYNNRYDNWIKYTTTNSSMEYLPEKYPLEQPPVGTTLTKETLDKYYRLPKVLIAYTNKPIWQRISYNLITSIILLLILWLIVRSFLYIILGGKFLSLKRD